MRTRPGASWRDAYLRVAEHLAGQASQARPVLTSTNACVDAIFGIDAERLGRLLARPAAASASASADDVAGGELVDRVLARILAGRGGELLTRWPAGPPGSARCSARPTGTRSAALARRPRGRWPPPAATACWPWPIAALGSWR